jgi:hypothetical protein
MTNKVWYRCRSCWAWKEFDNKSVIPFCCPDCKAKGSLEKKEKVAMASQRPLLSFGIEDKKVTRKTYKPRV